MKNNRILMVLLICLFSVCLSACGQEEIDAETKSEVIFEEDTVFSVNGELISEGEWNLYALPEIEKIGKLYGEDIWKYSVDADGKPFLEVIKSELERRISCVKIVAGKAEEMGIALTDDDMVEINIQTADYLDKLTPQQQKEKKITEELVKKVYSDNLLAMKVYEHLTLNVDTSTDEEQVRHMELQYVTVAKYTEDKDGNKIFYSDDEIALIRNKMELFVKMAQANAKENESGTLSDVNNDDYTVTTIIAGLEDLRERFPYDLAGKAFWLRENEISEVFETDDAFFVFDCVKLTDKEATDAARVQIIEQREKAVFDEKYAEWEAAAEIRHRQ